MKPGLLATIALAAAPIATCSCRGSDSRAGALPARACRAPAESIQPSLAFAAPRARLAGTYEFTVVATNGARSTDIAATGRLVLYPANPLHVRARNPRITHPLEGWTDIRIDSLAEVSLAYSPASRDPSAPGVQLISDGQRLDMIVGNAFRSHVAPSGETFTTFTTDSGVIFDVYHADSVMLRGRWRDGGFAAGSGYFCAWRVSE